MSKKVEEIYQKGLENLDKFYDYDPVNKIRIRQETETPYKLHGTRTK